MVFSSYGHTQEGDAFTMLVDIRFLILHPLLDVIA